MPYVAAMGAELVDYLLTLPTFETVILPIILSALCTIFSFMMLLLVGGNKKKKGANALLEKLGFLVGGGVLDSIPGLDIIPFGVASIILVYFRELSERKHAEG